MKSIPYISFFLIASLSISNTYGQTNISKKKSDAVINIDTTLNSLNNKFQTTHSSQDTSVQIIEEKLSNGEVVQMIIANGDTSYMYNMKTFNVADLKPYGDKVKDKQFRRLRYHVKKVYPYAKLASQKLRYYNAELLKVKSKRKRRQLLRMREKELKEEFTDVIKKMSKTSGKVLVKLIDRETGESTYDIIKEMRGGFKAFIYQGVGKLYGADLKQRYNPEENEEDEMIERIVQMIEAGKS